MMDRPDNDLVERYMRQELGVETDLQYAGGGVDTYWPHAREEYRAVDRRWTRSQVDEAESTPLETAFRLNPALKVIDMCGYYDLGANCIGDQYIVDQAGPEIARNVSVHLYQGGHAPYYVPEVRAEMKRDFRAFLESL